MASRAAGSQIRALEEADPLRPDEDTGLAEVTDGRELELMNGEIHRLSLPDGLRFRFRFTQLSKEIDGKPDAKRVGITERRR